MGCAGLPWEGPLIEHTTKKPQCAVRTPLAPLDLLRVPATTATARRLAAVMRKLDYIPIKSRRLMPGGRAGNTVTRGWARPVRTMKSSPTIENAGASGAKQLETIP